MAPTLVSLTAVESWARAQNGELANPARHDPSKSTAALWADKIEVHPDTAPDDSAYRRWGHSSAV
jgi:Ca2+-transporting ATPase